MDSFFAGKVALITGAGDGMGRACASLLAHLGTRVYMLSRSEPKLTDAALDIRSKSNNPHVFPIQADVSRAHDVSTALSQILSKEKGIDFLLCFAGYNSDYARISRDVPGPQALIDLEKIVSVDLIGTARFVFLVEPHMRASGQGVILSVGNGAMLESDPTDLTFQMAKIGLQQMTRVLAAQHRRDGFKNISTYCLAPGMVRNPTTFEGLDENQKAAAKKQGWLDSDLHIAPIVSWLLSGKLKRLSGQTISVNGQTAPDLFKEAGEPYQNLEI